MKTSRLVADYNSDSDSDELEGTDLSKASKNPPFKKRKIVLPSLPESILNGPHEKLRNDSILSHQGRSRSTPHVVGNWAVHVYIKVPIELDIREMLERIVLDAQSLSPDIISLLPEIHTDEGLHISLSRCIYLKTFQLKRFAQLLRESLEGHKSFCVSFAKIHHFTNDENTRSFIGLEIGAGYQELLSCLAKVDILAEQFNQQTFYKPPRFHASIAWALSLPPIEKCIQKLLPLYPKRLSTWEFKIDLIKLKIGNKIEDIYLMGT